MIFSGYPKNDIANRVMPLRSFPLVGIRYISAKIASVVTRLLAGTINVATRCGSVAAQIKTGTITTRIDK